MYDKKENLNNSCCLIVDNGLLETVCFRFYLFLPPFNCGKNSFMVARASSIVYFTFESLLNSSRYF